MVDIRAHAIFCDDIRIELNGKFILIGVYTGGLTVHETPQVFGLATFIEIDGLPIGKHHVRPAVEFYDGNETVHVGSLDLMVEVVDEQTPAILFPTGLEVHIQSAGTLRLELSVNGEAPISAGVLRVDVAPR